MPLISLSLFSPSSSLCTSFLKVQETEDILKGWTEKVVALRQQYTWLLFFSVPKLLKLHGLLINDSINISAIVHSISFLFENAFHVRKCMEPVIQVCYTGLMG